MARRFIPGDKINNYIVEQLINEGEFCNAYYAYHKISGQPVFLKQYKQPTKIEKWYKGFTQLQDELKKRLEKISIPELVEQSYLFFEYDDVYYQVKERVLGKDLYDLMVINGTPEEKLTKDEKEYCFGEAQWLTNSALVMSAIKEIHQLGIVHSDIKPQNIYMSKVNANVKFRAKLIDFDFSFIEGEKPPFTSENGGPGVVGTPGYLSPEHLTKNIPDRGSDIFSCGIILYELLCGPSPFAFLYEKYSNEIALNEAILVSVGIQSFKKPEELNPDLAEFPELCSIMVKMLAMKSVDRPSASDVHKVLLKCLKTMRTAVRIKLSSGSETYKSIHTDTVITHTNARIFGPDYKFVDENQFRIFKSRKNNKWHIEGLSPVANNTRLNGEIITGKAVFLKHNDEITVGELKLSVEFVY